MSNRQHLGLKKLNDVNGFPKQVSQQQVVKQVVGQVPPNNHVQTAVPQILDAKMVPIQITLPAQPGTNIGPRVLTIQVPAMALQGNQLHKVLTGPIITAAMSLPPPLASTILQQHVNDALSQQQQVVRQITKPVIQTDGMHLLDSSDEDEKPSTSKINEQSVMRLQVDGPMDTSDEEEEGTDEDEGSDDVDEDKEEEEQEVDEGGPEEEPLNSEDDVTDEDPADLFDTENVVVCQYDKVEL